MTHKTFWDDPYLTSLHTTITNVTGNDVSVAATIIYAFSGGQERDYGTLKRKNVGKGKERIEIGL